MNKLHILSIEIRNFMSYGDYVSKVELDALGPVLIIGNNGSGKSSLINAILWCLTGRLPHIPNPGDKIVNWHIGAGCYVTIHTADGWTITRTRLLDNHDDLIIHNNISDETRSTNKSAQDFINKHFGLDFDIFTNSIFCGQTDKSLMEMPDPKRRATIERMLGLDKLDLLSDAAKNKLEQTHNKYNANKEKYKTLQKNLESISEQIKDNIIKQKEFDYNLLILINKLSTDCDNHIAKLEKLKIPEEESIRSKWIIVHKLDNKIIEINRQIDDINNKIDSNDCLLNHLNKSKQEYHNQTQISFNIDDLRHQHKLCDEREIQLKSLIDKKTEFNSKLVGLRSILADAERRLKLWVTKSGTICSECEQEIESVHFEDNSNRIKLETKNVQDMINNTQRKLTKISDATKSIGIDRPSIGLAEADRIIQLSSDAHNKIKSINEDVAKLKIENQDIDDKRMKFMELCNDITKKIDQLIPTVTIEELNGLKLEKTEITSKIDLINQEIHTITKELNPYTIVVTTLEESISSIKKDLELINESIDKLQTLHTHIDYVYRAYRDRNKIRSYLLSEMVPFLNERIAYYLELFGFKIDVEFTSSLSVKSSRWDYNLCSGGQRKRIDLSVMFAIHDLHVLLYGPRCNLLILDEVDGRLDADGIDKFVEIVYNDFAGDDDFKPNTILVISHKLEMSDAFPTKIKVNLKDGFSYIESSA